MARLPLPCYALGLLFLLYINTAPAVRNNNSHSFVQQSEASLTQHHPSHIYIVISSFLFYHLYLLSSSSLIPSHHSQFTIQQHYTVMCYRLVELYAACRCLYFRHAIDPCQSYGQRNHPVQEKTTFVGWACPRHSAQQPADQSSPSHNLSFPDSGYSSCRSAFR